jgi:regulator of cell morphogenesis and NO signaling
MQENMKIKKEMIVRDVVKQYPQTVNVFGRYKVDFCCGGAHSIEQTARTGGCRDVDGLLAELNRVVEETASPQK